MNKKNRAKGAMILLFAGVLLLWVASVAQAANELVSVKSNTVPTIDGKVDDVWNNAAPLQFLAKKTPYKPNNGYPGIKKTMISIRSMHDGEYVYFLVQYDDPTQSLERYPWVKQVNGSWKQLKNKDNTGHENTYYEDKFAILWNINSVKFEKRGCAALCHKNRGGKIAGIKDKVPARKYTQKEGVTVDMWHWKSVRSNPVGQMDDQFIDHVKDPKINKNWGRHGDAKTGGGYKSNFNKIKTGPAFMNNSMSPDTKYFVVPSTKVAFKDTFKTGDVVPGIVVSPFQGPRGDIQAKGVWSDGKWTIEMKRKLVTNGDKAEIQDVQFNDLKKSYLFGVAVFDNSQINHVYTTKKGTLVFK